MEPKKTKKKVSIKTATPSRAPPRLPEAVAKRRVVHRARAMAERNERVGRAVQVGAPELFESGRREREEEARGCAMRAARRGARAAWPSESARAPGMMGRDPSLFLLSPVLQSSAVASLASLFHETKRKVHATKKGNS